MNLRSHALSSKGSGFREEPEFFNDFFSYCEEALSSYKRKQNPTLRKHLVGLSNRDRCGRILRDDGKVTCEGVEREGVEREGEGVNPCTRSLVDKHWVVNFFPSVEQASLFNIV